MRKPKKIPQIITPDDLDKILNAIINKYSIRDEDGNMIQKKNLSRYKSFSIVRDICMIYFMYYTGLRPRECFNAKLNYLNMDKGTFYIPAMANKQRFEDIMPLPDFVIDFLKKYLKIRQRNFPFSEWLFPARSQKKHTGRLDQGTFIKTFRKALRDSGLLRVSYLDAKGKKRYNYSLYNLRASYGTLVYFQTKDLRKTAAMLRHRDYFCRSTLCYIQTAQNIQKQDILKEIFPDKYFKLAVRRKHEVKQSL